MNIEAHFQKILNHIHYLEGEQARLTELERYLQSELAKLRISIIELWLDGGITIDQAYSVLGKHAEVWRQELSLE